MIRKRVKEGRAHEVDESEPEVPAPGDEEGVDMLTRLKGGEEERAQEGDVARIAANARAACSWRLMASRYARGISPRRAGCPIQ